MSKKVSAQSHISSLLRKEFVKALNHENRKKGILALLKTIDGANIEMKDLDKLIAKEVKADLPFLTRRNNDFEIAS